MGRLLPAPVRGIIWKDFLLLRRDLRNLSQLISPLIFGVIYSFMLFRTGGQPPAGQGDAPDWFMNSFRILLSYGNVGMSLFVGWWLLGRLSGMAFSSEGRNYWMLKAAPVRPGYLLAAKFLVAYLPTLALGLFFLVGISLLQKIPTRRVFVQPAGRCHVPGRDERHPAGIWSGGGQFQMGRPA